MLGKEWSDHKHNILIFQIYPFLYSPDYHRLAGGSKFNITFLSNGLQCRIMCSADNNDACVCVCMRMYVSKGERERVNLNVYMQ